MIDKYLDAQWEIQSVFSNRFEKTADFSPDVHVPDEIQNYISELTPDSNSNYIHVIAATDGRRYGSNLNGDILDGNEMTGTQTEQESIQNPGEFSGVQLPRYKTFEQARFYRHHANSPTDPAYGDVPVAAWNEPMRRVELIIRVYKKDMPELGGYGAPDIIAKLDRRGFICVSMGMRIHHETCMYCGAENELVKDRCDCLKNHMNEIMPNGQRVQANNFGMRFFDISDVGIPADPACFSLSKVASPTQHGNFAKDVDEFVMGAWMTKQAEFTTESISNISASSTPPLGMSDSAPIELNESEIKEAFVACGSLDTLVSTAALMGIVFSPRELTYATSLSEPTKCAQSVSACDGIKNLSLDNFSISLYHSLLSKTAERSGYFVPCPKTGWQPEKIAESGYEDVADYYSYYRGLLGSLSRTSFIKAAHLNPYVRDLIKNDHDRVENALYHLAHAGMAV